MRARDRAAGQGTPSRPYASAAIRSIREPTIVGAAAERFEVRRVVAAHARRCAEIAEDVEHRAGRDQRTGHRARALARRRRGDGLRVLVEKAGEVERVLLVDHPVGCGHAALGQRDARRATPAIAARRTLPAALGRRIVEVIRAVRGGHVGERGAGGEPRERGLAAARVGHRAVRRRQQVEVLDQRVRVGGRDRELLEQAAVEAERDEPLMQARRERRLFGEPGVRGLGFPGAGGLRGDDEREQRGALLQHHLTAPPSPMGTSALSLPYTVCSSDDRVVDRRALADAARDQDDDAALAVEEADAADLVLGRLRTSGSRPRPSLGCPGSCVSSSS